MLVRRELGKPLVGMAKPIAKLVSMLTPKRRWAQFSLATMLIVVTVLCVWLSVVVNRAHRQRDAVAAIQALGAVRYLGDEAESKSFLRWLLSRDYTDEVVTVYLSKASDSDLIHLHSLSRLHGLYLLGTSQITDAGLVHISAITSLERLFLGRSKVSDLGVAELKEALPNCEIIASP